MPARFAPRALALLAALFALSSSSARVAFAQQQVGYPPDASPFRDVDYKQQITGFTGWFNASKDPAGVAPRSGPIIGARYDVRVGGPAQFSARLARVWSNRRTLDPRKPLAQRLVSDDANPIYIGDLDLAINLTGTKSIHNFIPVLSGGAGIVSDFSSKPDTGGYQFGTNFAFSFGAGLRWVPGGHLEIRADLTDYLYQLTYPDTYYVQASDSTRILSNKQASHVWKHNGAVTIGASYAFFR